MADRGSRDDHQGTSRRAVPWRGRLATLLLGLAGGVGVNLLSEGEMGVRVFAAAAGGAGVLSAATWVRQLPPRAPLVRWSTRTLLALAIAAIITAAVTPSPWAGYCTIAASALTLAAVLIPTDTKTASSLLRGAALIGVGAATIGLGIVALRNQDTLYGTATIGAGAAFIGLGIAALRDQDTLAGAAFIGLGAATIGVGIVALRNQDTLYGTAIIGAGAAFIGLGIALVRDQDTLAGTALTGGGAALIGVGIAALRDQDTLAGTAGIGFGAGTIGFGISMLQRSGALQRLSRRLTSLTEDPGTAADDPAPPGEPGPETPQRRT